ncbi:MAG: ribosome silencing factor [candidate division Zixibacteria bacterium]|nr:ribosome silencing factor [Candidatus Tariuqbacter arcticus]
MQETDTDSKQLTEKIVRLALEKRALDVVTLNVRQMTTVCDYFIIASGAVDVHLMAVADYILEGTASEGVRPLHIEGYDNLRWVLIDFTDVVVHLFLPEVRKFYSIERLWGEAEAKHYESK